MSIAANIRRFILHKVLQMTGFEIKAEYVDSAPSHQNAIDLFRGEWASKLPVPHASGDHRLFDDARIAWLIKEIDGVRGMHVLDCGPLEGGHAYSLEAAGAEVTAVEANTRAFLRCLVAKEVLGMRTRFSLGDFVEYLRAAPRFDLIVASGVLYHLVNPVEAIALASRATDRLYLWTHYFDPEHTSRSVHFDQPRIETTAGFRHELHRQEYRTKLGNPGFFGGAQASSSWMSRSDLLAALDFFGFDRIRVHFDNPETHPGPSISLLAERMYGRDGHRKPEAKS